jgi:hypothetical protein|tara:strand:- start:849 stop:2495 length:1647 start_codon:yes stop_codon:yes gene_type:complete
MKNLYSLLLFMSITLVFGQNTAPVANDQSVSTDQYSPVNITLTGSDSDLATVFTVHTLKGSKLENSSGSGFGEYIELSSDGTRVVVGGWSQNNVRVFEWDGSEWGQLGQTIDGVSGGYLGEFVSISNDGNRIAAYDTNKQKVYTYYWSGSSWAQEGTTVMSLTANRGLNLSGDGNTLAAVDFAGGKINLRKWDGSAWTSPYTVVAIQIGGGEAPGMVSLSNDGTRFAIGTKINNQVNIYDLSGGVWSKSITIDGSSGENFGQTLRLTSDGQKLIVGVNGIGSARVYNVSGSNATQIGPDIYYGSNAAWRAISISDDGKRAAIPVFNQKTGVFDWDGTNWNQLGADITAASLWGESLDISSDGKILAIGGHNGIVKVYDVLNLQYIITSYPSNGTLKQGSSTISSSDIPYTFKIKDPAVTYTANSGFAGSDSFKFKLNDTTVDSNIATVSISVQSGGFSLNDDNNKIQVSSCTCNGKKDGAINLSIEDSNYDYTVTVSGQSSPVLIAGVNKTASVTGLAKGTYTVCFKVDGQPGYEQCFEAVIAEPNGL